MEKNYNYNYENKSQGQKLPIGYSNLGVSSCTSKVLAKSPVTNGSLWYTTDENEFYYDWNGKRIKLNLTGDNASIVAELNKIKEEIKNLDPDAVKKMVKDLETKVNGAAQDANDAAKVAQDAAAQVANKADVSYVNNAIAGKADASVVTTLQNTVSDLETSISNKANASDVTALSQAISNKADSSKVETLAQSVTSLSDAVSGKADVSDVTTLQNTVSSLQGTKVDKSDLDVYAKESWVEGKGFLTALDISGKANVSDLKTVATTGNYNDLENKPDLTGFATTSALDTLKSDLSTGSFPENVDDKLTQSNGYTKVQDVMNYVNALIEKKKGELAPSGEVKDYLYVNGVSYTDDNILPTPGTIYDMNCYEISDTLISDGLKVYVGPEILGFDEGNPDTTIYSEVFSVDVPTGYEIKVHMWDQENNKWFTSDLTMMSNPKQATKLYGGKTYNCFVRELSNNFTDARPVNVRYKIIINKNQQ